MQAKENKASEREREREYIDVKHDKYNINNKK